MNRAGQMIVRKFAFLANVDEQELVAPIQSFFHLIDVGFADAAAGVFDNLEEAGRMLVSHKSFLSHPDEAAAKMQAPPLIALMVTSYAQLCACSAATASFSMNPCRSRKK